MHYGSWHGNRQIDCMLIFDKKNNSFPWRFILSSWASTNIWSADNLEITLLKNSTINERAELDFCESLRFESRIFAQILAKNICHFRNPFSPLTRPHHSGGRYLELFYPTGSIFHHAKCYLPLRPCSTLSGGFSEPWQMLSSKQFFCCAKSESSPCQMCPCGCCGCYKEQNVGVSFCIIFI